MFGNAVHEVRLLVPRPHGAIETNLTLLKRRHRSLPSLSRCPASLGRDSRPARGLMRLLVADATEHGSLLPALLRPERPRGLKVRHTPSRRSIRVTAEGRGSFMLIACPRSSGCLPAAQEEPLLQRQPRRAAARRRL